ATPETLIGWSAEGRLNTMALAGTQPMPANGSADDVHWADKFIEEQAHVCRYIRSAFNVCGIDAIQESRPHTVVAGNLMHLRSEFVARIDPQRADLAMAFLAAMHPTSAVCGQPREAALAFLRDNEGYDRSFYCGYIGPVGLDGASHLFVNLRTAQLIGDTAYLYVGGGVVAKSDPQAEWVETVEKLKTVGAVLASGAVPGAVFAAEPVAGETSLRDASAGSSAPRD
ncbi:MAG: chorismate-binding protein, partial [Proteobacteria bacterium]|nr:chorismate-binding protein [Pseudomonadota bacterium]